jgi:membrane-associated phospholipid phosphatase
MVRFFALFLFSFQTAVISSQSLDYRLLKRINQNTYPTWDATMKGMSHSVYIITPLSILSIATDGFVRKDQVMKRNSVKAFATVGMAAGVTLCLKYSIRRKRPDAQYPGIFIVREQVGRFSFPSGSTTLAFATATSLSLSYKKWYITLPSYLYAGMVSYSRMRLGVHYPSDVLAGAIIGTCSGFLVWKLDKVIFKK